VVFKLFERVFLPLPKVSYTLSPEALRAIKALALTDKQVCVIMCDGDNADFAYDADD
jgi:hypothetical protein